MLNKGMINNTKIYQQSDDLRVCWSTGRGIVPRIELQFFFFWSKNYQSSLLSEPEDVPNFDLLKFIKDKFFNIKFFKSIKSSIYKDEIDPYEREYIDEKYGKITLEIKELLDAGYEQGIFDVEKSKKEGVSSEKVFRIEDEIQEEIETNLVINEDSVVKEEKERLVTEPNKKVDISVKKVSTDPETIVKEGERVGKTEAMEVELTQNTFIGSEITATTEEGEEEEETPNGKKKLGKMVGGKFVPIPVKPKDLTVFNAGRNGIALAPPTQLGFGVSLKPYAYDMDMHQELSRENLNYERLRPIMFKAGPEQIDYATIRLLDIKELRLHRTRFEQFLFRYNMGWEGPKKRLKNKEEQKWLRMLLKYIYNPDKLSVFMHQNEYQRLAVYESFLPEDLKHFQSPVSDPRIVNRWETNPSRRCLPMGITKEEDEVFGTSIGGGPKFLFDNSEIADESKVDKWKTTTRNWFSRKVYPGKNVGHGLTSKAYYKSNTYNANYYGQHANIVSIIFNMDNGAVKAQPLEIGPKKAIGENRIFIPFKWDDAFGQGIEAASWSPTNSQEELGLFVHIAALVWLIEVIRHEIIGRLLEKYPKLGDWSYEVRKRGGRMWQYSGYICYTVPLLLTFGGDFGDSWSILHGWTAYDYDSGFSYYPYEDWLFELTLGGYGDDPMEHEDYEEGLEFGYIDALYGHNIDQQPLYELNYREKFGPPKSDKRRSIDYKGMRYPYFLHENNDYADLTENRAYLDPAYKFGLINSTDGSFRSSYAAILDSENRKILAENKIDRLLPILEGPYQDSILDHFWRDRGVGMRENQKLKDLTFSEIHNHEFGLYPHRLDQIWCLEFDFNFEDRLAEGLISNYGQTLGKSFTFHPGFTVDQLTESIFTKGIEAKYYLSDKYPLWHDSDAPNKLQGGEDYFYLGQKCFPTRIIIHNYHEGRGEWPKGGADEGRRVAYLRDRVVPLYSEQMDFFKWCALNFHSEFNAKPIIENMYLDSGNIYLTDLPHAPRFRDSRQYSHVRSKTGDTFLGLNK